MCSVCFANKRIVLWIAHIYTTIGIKTSFGQKKRTEVMKDGCLTKCYEKQKDRKLWMCIRILAKKKWRYISLLNPHTSLSNSYETRSFRDIMKIQMITWNTTVFLFFFQTYNKQSTISQVNERTIVAKVHW